MEMKIKVTPEGREGVWTADKDSIVDFLHNYEFEQIHNYTPGRLMLGADWDKDSVIKEAKNSEKIAILTGDSFIHNMRHALALIVDNKLLMFDIGEISECNLSIA